MFPQRAGLLGLNGGGTAAVVPSMSATFLIIITTMIADKLQVSGHVQLKDSAQEMVNTVGKLSMTTVAPSGEYGCKTQ